MIIGKTRTNQPVEGDVEGLSELFETGKVENAKPIYCHPCYLKYNRSADSDLTEITMLIFNNDSEAFTKASFIEWAKNLFELNENAKILTSGFYTNLPACCLKKSGQPNDYFTLIMAGNATTSYTASLLFTDILLETTIFEDGVNKIN